MFNQIDLFTDALGLQEPWKVIDVKFDISESRLDIYISRTKGSKVTCPVCEKECSVHDSKERTWRHLNFFQYKAFIHCKVPRCKCDDHGVKQIEVPWTRQGAGFTLLFEAFIMMLVRNMPVKAVADLIGIKSDRIWRIIDHYVAIAYESIEFSDVTTIGLDETSSKRGHNYITLFVDLDKSKVLFATERKDASTIKSFKETFESHNGNVSSIENISCDMSPAFINGANKHFPDANITFDKFHVIKRINEAVDTVRREEAKENELLKNTRYIWLKNPENLTTKQQNQMEPLSKTKLKTLRAYNIKLNLQEFYEIDDIEAAFFHLKKWFFWATHSKLEPMIDAAYFIKRHWDGIIKYTTTKITNGVLEGINSIIQAIKRRARGYGTTKHFISMVYLVCSNLEFNLPIAFA
ncbi:MAG: ISL3 family transposase [Clostridia bacterium]|nr:ISL3 family transposase [Clostridia bacterium]